MPARSGNAAGSKTKALLSGNLHSGRGDRQFNLQPQIKCVCTRIINICVFVLSTRNTADEEFGFIFCCREGDHTPCGTGGILVPGCQKEPTMGFGFG